MTSKGYSKLTAGLITVWFAFSIIASGLNVFDTSPNLPPLRLLLAVLIPIVLFAAWYMRSAAFRAYVLSLDPRTLTAVQSWRIAGFVFLVLYSYRMLPGMFALPAGWGDIFIGATALLVAAKWATPTYRKSFIFWQWLGVADLMTAMVAGAAGRFIRPEDFTGASGFATSSMTALPLSLIPVFAVPFFLIVHIICIAQARRWPRKELNRANDRLRSVAVQP
jgi:hypothetical protein